ncbi:MAG: putative transposase [Verrucomicrobiota bacterium]|jgi:putative transposase
MKTATPNILLRAAKAARHTKVTGSVKVDRPGEVALIGHVIMDCIVLDEQGLVGRPWLSLMIDACSEMALGYNLSLASPSSTSVGRCIVHTILPKSPTLLRLGLSEKSWPCWGMVNVVHTRLDSRSEDLDTAANEYGFEITYPSSGNAPDFLTMEKVLRQIADKVQEWGFSCGRTVSLQDVERYVVTWILESYVKQAGQTLGGKTPLQIHGEGYAQFGAPPICVNPQRLELDFLPSFRRCVQWYGVVIDGLNYDSAILDPYSRDHDKKGCRIKHLFGGIR